MTGVEWEASLKAEDASKARQLHKALEEAAHLAGRLEGREESGAVHAEAVDALASHVNAQAQHSAGTLATLTERVPELFQTRENSVHASAFVAASGHSIDRFCAKPRSSSHRCRAM